MPGRVYVQLEEVKEKKQGAIYLPDKHSVPSRKGLVIECGDGVKTVKPGDKIIVQYYSGVVLDFYELAATGGVDSYRIITPEEVVCIYED